ncbi:MAG: DNA polymerase IV, partial [Pseudomonadota bacterium]
MTSVCRDCDTVSEVDPAACPACGSGRILSHPHLTELSIAHIDCDAFFAAIEKRDNPDLRDKPVIVGGGKRGVVATCCYIARLHGVRSAMPMFKALKLCPEAVVVRPDREAYSTASRQIREKLQALTPLVQMISIDEGYLDLTGTERVNGAIPAASLTRIAREIEEEIGITISVGLSENKFLAKTASEMDKPRGFAVISAAEARALLAPKP